MSFALDMDETIRWWKRHGSKSEWPCVNLEGGPMNPDRLRGLSLPDWPYLKERVADAADTWEAERAVFTHVAKERDLLRNAHILDMAVADILRKRLEEAEKVIRFAEGELGIMHKVGRAAWQYLAGEGK
jgi:hypothetical protein